MVPLAALTRFEPRPGPEFTMRFNEYRSAQINGAAAPGFSAGQAMAAHGGGLRPNHAAAKWATTTWACPSRRKKPSEGVPASAVLWFFSPLRLSDSRRAL